MVAGGPHHPLPHHMPSLLLPASKQFHNRRYRRTAITPTTIKKSNRCACFHKSRLLKDRMIPRSGGAALGSLIHDVFTKRTKFDSRRDAKMEDSMGTIRSPGDCKPYAHFESGLAGKPRHAPLSSPFISININNGLQGTLQGKERR